MVSNTAHLSVAFGFFAEVAVLVILRHARQLRPMHYSSARAGSEYTGLQGVSGAVSQDTSPCVQLAHCSFRAANYHLF